MPIYEFLCDKCKTETELLRHMDEADDPVECPQCKEIMRRKISQTTFILMGGGWAADGYSH